MVGAFGVELYVVTYVCFSCHRRTLWVCVCVCVLYSFYQIYAQNGDWFRSRIEISTRFCVYDAEFSTVISASATHIHSRSFCMKLAKKHTLGRPSDRLTSVLCTSDHQNCCCCNAIVLVRCMCVRNDCTQWLIWWFALLKLHVYVCLCMCVCVFQYKYDVCAAARARWNTWN